MSSKDKKSTRFVLFFSLGAFILGGACVFIWTSVIKDAQLEQNIDDLNTLQTELDNIVRDDQEQFEGTGSATDNAGQQPATSRPAVVYDPGGLFPSSLRDELTTKLIEPYTDFHDTKKDEPVSFHISQSSNSAGWSVVVVNKDSSYQNIEFGNRNKSEQLWWTPICINPCNFTDSFKSMYPEVVSQYQ